jgi:5-methylcytosine-specific restriction enzyme A
MTKIAKSVGRPVKEWSSDNPAAMPPPAVRLRILRRFESKCQLSGIVIADGQAFDLEHKKPIEEGGENRENNLVPVLRLPHELKTAIERKRQAKADRIAKKAHGLTAPKQTIKSAGFPQIEKPRRGVDKSSLEPLPRRSIYE